jgi:hypothetical protein
MHETAKKDGTKVILWNSKSVLFHEFRSFRMLPWILWFKVSGGRSCLGFRGLPNQGDGISSINTHTFYATLRSFKVP